MTDVAEVSYDRVVVVVVDSKGNSKIVKVEKGDGNNRI